MAGLGRAPRYAHHPASAGWGKIGDSAAPSEFPNGQRMMPTRPRPWLFAFGGAVAIFLIAPSAVVIVMSFSSGKILMFPPPGFGIHWYENFFGSQEWIGSAFNSLEIAIISSLLATFLGTITAFGLVRGRALTAQVTKAIILMPLIVPLVVTAIGMYFTYQSMGLSTLAGIVVAHTALGLPYVVVTVAASLYGFDADLELAARNLGANPWRSFSRITLPLIMPGVATGAIFAFISSWDEVIVALFLTTPTLRTLPVTMWEQTKSTVDPTIAAASSLLTTFTLFLLLMAVTLRRFSAGTTKERPL
jgi:putative spermidine/putrescine transport system permease protein